MKQSIVKDEHSSFKSYTDMAFQVLLILFVVACIKMYRKLSGEIKEELRGDKDDAYVRETKVLN